MNTVTVDREVLEQALQALKSLFNWQTDPDRGQRCSNAIAALEIALAQGAQEPEKENEQEPVARVLQTVGQYPTGRFVAEVETVCRLRIGEYLYTQPPSLKDNQEAYNYARSIAEAIWKKHYKDIAPHWKPHSDLLILLTQIDNMTATLRPAVL
jgi:hypothetical protein